MVLNSTLKICWKIEQSDVRAIVDNETHDQLYALLIMVDMSFSLIIEFPKTPKT